MSTVWPIAGIVVIGFLVWFARSQWRSALLAVREDQIRKIAKINNESKKIDEQTEQKINALADPDADPRAMWLRDKKRLPALPGPGAPGNPV